jgi:hypothetical protein
MTGVSHLLAEYLSLNNTVTLRLMPAAHRILMADPKNSGVTGYKLESSPDFEFEIFCTEDKRPVFARIRGADTELSGRILSVLASKEAAELVAEDIAEKRFAGSHLVKLEDLELNNWIEYGPAGLKSILNA